MARLASASSRTAITRPARAASTGVPHGMVKSKA
jgi:hypothetical protein